MYFEEERRREERRRWCIEQVTDMVRAGIVVEAVLVSKAAEIEEYLLNGKKETSSE